MSTDPTERDPIESTMPASHNQYDINPYTSLPLLPPPPPKQRSHKGWGITLLTLTLLIIVGSTLYFLMYRSVPQADIQAHAKVTPIPTHALTPTPTMVLSPAPDPNYTAIDIVQHMMDADKTIRIFDQNETIWQFSHDNYFISVYASSSVQFDACPGGWGNCADAGNIMGIWIYAIRQDAATAFQQVSNDAAICNDSSPRSVLIVTCGGYESEYTHGRCLILNNDSSSTYGQIVTQYCI